MENDNLPSKNTAKQLLPISVLKNLGAYTKIKEFSKVGHLVMPICNKHAVLSAIDKEIDQFTKEEIAKYTSFHLKNLTFEEIEIAFQNERFNLYEKKTVHYNFFSIDYFVEIINKYKIWKQSQMTIHNIALNQTLLQQTSKQTNEENKKNIRKEFFSMIFNELQDTKKQYIYDAFTLYEDFVACGLINITDEEKKSIYKVMEREVIKETNIQIFKTSKKTIKNELKKYVENISKSNKNTTVINKCKAYLVCKTIKQHKSANELLEKINL